MQLPFKEYTIEINNLRGLDFSHLYNTENLTDDYSSIAGIKIFRDEEILHTALISAEGGETTIHDTSQVIQNDTLALCCGDKIFNLILPTLRLNWQQEVDLTCFQIFTYEDGYIVHGELTISRLSQDGKILWQFGGQDIFVNLQGKKEFDLAGNKILLTNFSGARYEVDADSGIGLKL